MIQPLMQSFSKTHARMLVLAITLSIFLIVAPLTPSRAQDTSPILTASNVGQIKPLMSILATIAPYSDYDYYDEYVLHTPPSRKALFSPDGSLVVYTSRNSALVNLKTGQKIPISGSGIPSAFAGDGKWLVLDNALTTSLWDIT